jgi:5-methylcytosine-specific restriction endonuclease McrA
MRARDRERNAQRREYVAEKSRLWREQNPEKYQAAESAKKERRKVDLAYKAKTAAYHAANRDSRNAKINAWHREHPESTKAKRAARRARLRAAPGRVTAHDLRRQMESQDGLCFWCKAALAGRYHADHFVPLARGGTNNAGNIVCSCGPCNQRKHAKLPSEFFGVFGRAA